MVAADSVMLIQCLMLIRWLCGGFVLGLGIVIQSFVPFLLWQSFCRGKEIWLLLKLLLSYSCFTTLPFFYITISVVKFLPQMLKRRNLIYVLITIKSSLTNDLSPYIYSFTSNIPLV